MLQFKAQKGQFCIILALYHELKSTSKKTAAS